jgi:hypothetical protein
VVVATVALVPVLGVITAALGGWGSESSGGERRCGESGSETHLYEKVMQGSNLN